MVRSEGVVTTEAYIFLIFISVSGIKASKVLVRNVRSER